MNPTDLDDTLTTMAVPLSSELRTAALGVVDATTPPRVREGRRPRARWVLPVVVGGALALTAGAGTATVVMSHWAGVGMPLENVRSNEPIPVTWTTGTGHVEQCRAWIELRNPQVGDQATLDRAISQHGWTGLGQRLYDAAPPLADDADGERRVDEALEPVLRSFAGEAFPGVAWLGETRDASARAVDAWGMTCVPEAEG
ncbi:MULTISPECIES: hypothetical protein [Microbacterium]|uniref:hypothetical protein n=1 Tax=Microbacterium TaxID=33882 RepID=UPI00344FAC77